MHPRVSWGLPSATTVRFRPRLRNPVCSTRGGGTSPQAADFTSSARCCLGKKYLAKQAAAAEAWAARAERIKNGEEANLWDTFESRGYVKEVAGTRDGVRELMRLKRIGAYVGIDPTAPSLHVGHLLPLMAVFWMYMHGYRAVTLIGGATAKVGDPSGRLKDRESGGQNFAKNMASLQFQLKRIWTNAEAQARRYGYERDWAWRRDIVNNNRWWNKQPLLEVLQKLGRHVRVGPMLSRDMVKRKMTEGDGLSFAELSYTLMQGWDFWELNKQLGVQMQIGGSDQYGNIVTGLEAVKILREDTNRSQPGQFPAGFEHDPVGFTVPLLTNSAGEKIGKSSGGGNLWLDTFQTSAYDLYGYFVRQSDEDVEKLLKLLTFVPSDDIRVLMEEHESDRRKRVAQHRLAFEVLTLVHGIEVAKHTENEHKVLHGKDPSAVNFIHNPKAQSTPNNVASSINMQLPRSLILNGNIARILYAAGLATSVSDGHRLATQKAVYIGGKPNGTGMGSSQIDFKAVALWYPEETKKFIIDDKLLILRKGKHNVRIIELVSDEEYQASGQTYPGQPGTGKLRMLRNEMKALAELQGSQAGDGDGRTDPSKRSEIREGLETQLQVQAERLDRIRKELAFFEANFDEKRHNPSNAPHKIKMRLDRGEAEYARLKEAHEKLSSMATEEPKGPNNS